ncbi:acylphosphatase [Nakamurella sp. YIM 132087]|uniref:acylphosphatase n=1 Tax=Nakamurella alba TaxID=2665158 RepID=A0A7K1FHI5_9ACTN|nr:acylphosphatase [Nakamurella alba]MTD13526.1 acylphosphatase [Nakamurella alba]
MSEESVGGTAQQEPADDGGGEPAAVVRLTAFVAGRVQGVGFRWWTRARALELGLTGSATNLADRRVQVVAEGSREACEALLDLLRGGATPGTVDHVAEQWGNARGEIGFLER